MVDKESLEKIRFDVLLKQYEMLRQEAHQRLSFFVQIYQIYVVVLTAVYGYIIANKHWDILLLFPIISLSLYLRFVWDQRVGVIISEYMTKNIEPWFRWAIQHGERVDLDWKMWEDYWPEVFKGISPWYKHSAFIIFGPVSIIPTLLYTTYNSYALIANRPLLTEINQLSLGTGLFGPVMMVASLVCLAVFWWVYRTTYRHAL